MVDVGSAASLGGQRMDRRMEMLPDIDRGEREEVLVSLGFLKIALVALETRSKLSLV